MLKAIADTHAVLWYLLNDTRLSAIANQVFDDANAQHEQIGISSITLTEVVYLQEKGRIPPQALQDIFQAFDETDPLFIEIPVDRQIAVVMGAISRVQVPDMPDRIIAATALRYAVPLISRDGKIRLSQVPTIW